MTGRAVLGYGPTDCHVAVDLVRIKDVESSVERFGDHYLRRVYTEHEISTCHSLPGSGRADVQPSVGLAARFAAKSATARVLESFGVASDLRSIEVSHHPEGAFGVSLIGSVAAAAASAGVGRMAASLSHGGGKASAVVTALWDGSPRASVGVGGSSPARHRTGAIESRIRIALADHGQLAEDAEALGVDDDLYRSGLTSHASVDVLLALEEASGLRLPSIAQWGPFRSIARMEEALGAVAGSERLRDARNDQVGSR